MSVLFIDKQMGFKIPTTARDIAAKMEKHLQLSVSDKLDVERFLSAMAAKYAKGK